MYEIKRPVLEPTWKDMVLEKLAGDMVAEFDQQLVDALKKVIEDEERL